MKNFEQTGDLYCLSPQVWVDISEDMAQGANGFPAAFGDKIRRIDKNYYKYRAYEWKIWNDILMPILMHDRLPTYHYHNLTGDAEAMAIACSTCVSLVKVDKVQKLLEQFTEYYEGSFYKYDWAQLGATSALDLSSFTTCF